MRRIRNAARGRGWFPREHVSPRVRGQGDAADAHGVTRGVPVEHVQAVPR